MIITGPAPARQLVRFAAAISGLWVLGWVLFLQGLAVVMALHAIGISS